MSTTTGQTSATAVATTAVNWRERHQQIREWKRQKKADKQRKLLAKTGAVVDDDGAADTTNGVTTNDATTDTTAAASASESMDITTTGAETSTTTTDSGRQWTASIAVPFSIVENAQSAELKAYLIGQIARSLVVFNIDEIVVFDEYCSQQPPITDSTDNSLQYDKRRSAMVQMIRILQYLECPQYLRKYLFPLQKDLQYAGLCNPLDSTHHLKTADTDCRYREGVVTNKPAQEGRGSHVYIGLQRDVQIDRSLRPNVRVTVRLADNCDLRRSKRLKGVAVSPDEPRELAGLYWGYQIRVAKSLSAVFGESPYAGGYDLTIGTSDRGDNVDKHLRQLPKRFNHLLVVFGGLKGIEAAHDSDESLSSVEDTRDLFDHYLNTCPNQGSNTIRTEEAILITLSALRKRLLR
ncbi:putative methyltransferase C9orf114 [Oppia nitens]|uniref:putative methyltransferase C9orf114 n=1 Tax=Oppia nitens TaxID=1686743 RepID=UPI0023D9D332|nr:putative methyltransferase C9orf114 [Oppia nitens]